MKLYFYLNGLYLSLFLCVVVSGSPQWPRFNLFHKFNLLGNTVDVGKYGRTLPGPQSMITMQSTTTKLTTTTEPTTIETTTTTPTTTTTSSTTTTPTTTTQVTTTHPKTTACTINLSFINLYIASATTTFDDTTNRLLSEEYDFFALDTTVQNLFNPNVLFPYCSNIVNSIISANLIHTKLKLCLSTVQINKKFAMISIQQKYDTAVANCDPNVS